LSVIFTYSGNILDYSLRAVKCLLWAFKRIIVLLYWGTLWHLWKCLQYILVRCTPSVILLYPPPPKVIFIYKNHMKILKNIPV
jgi:hypothetical protein